MASLAEKEGPFPWLGNEKKPNDDDKCWADDNALGKEFPSIETVEYVKGTGPEKDNGKPTVYLFWAKFSKGHFKTFMQFSDVNRVFEGVNVVGIGIDAKKKDSEKMLTKIGTPMATQGIDALEFDYDMAWDKDFIVKKAVMETIGTKLLTPGTAFLVDKDNKIVWKETYTPTYMLKDSMFVEQVDRISKGEDLFTWGPDTRVEEEEEENAVKMTINLDDDDY